MAWQILIPRWDLKSAKTRPNLQLMQVTRKRKKHGCEKFAKNPCTIWANLSLQFLEHFSGVQSIYFSFFRNYFQFILKVKIFRTIAGFCII